MMDKSIGAVEETVIGVDEEIVELELDELDLVAGGVGDRRGGCCCCCPRCGASNR
ncbi:hypothetical protein [Sorangium sp. So ce204]|uniref:hypothetical protein n=1 Tax=Sorangium sp. So ce204 TaxID=3133288 RepID=UPI003F6171BF